MNLVGTDVSKAVEIRLGNFPDKWRLAHPAMQPGPGRAATLLYINSAASIGTQARGCSSSFSPTPGHVSINRAASDDPTGRRTPKANRVDAGVH
ncbi:hypothetical protein ACHAW6_000151 [Cyclotella cf. meneghiniana]